MGKKCDIPDVSDICPNISQADLDKVNNNTEKTLKQMGTLQTTVGKAVKYVQEINGQKDAEKKAKDDKLKNFLAELAIEDLLVNPGELEKEFDDIVLSLKKANQRKELNGLLKKAKNKSLNKSDEERLAELTNIPKY